MTIPAPILAAAVLLAPAFAQTPPAAPSFEVASVKVSAMGEGKNRETIQATPGSLSMRNITLKSCIRWAYHVMDPQVSGPEWLNSQRYDIVGKAAGPAKEDELRPMLQTLLASRFKLELHRETRELSVFLLVVGKNGPKFKVSQTEGESSIEPQRKTMEVVIQRAQVSQLVDALANIFHTPVIDMTGLTGKYDITINASKYIDRQGGGSDGPPDPLALIMQGLQEELGLKLEAKKQPVELLVIDHAEKTPTEN